MTRGVRAVNRAAALLVGLVLLAAGVAAVLWWSGLLGDWWSRTPSALDAGRADEVVDRSWFGGVATVSGVLLGLLALWWLLAHLRTPRVRTLALSGSDGSGRLTLDAAALAGHVAQEARRLPGVVGARAQLDRERGRDVLVSTLQVDPQADLPELGKDVAALVMRARDVGGLRGMSARTHLAVRRRAREGPRVR
ncbi:hypothetical protein J1G42_00130 [Cellulomonas sp. zg-ZUI222]|uniref:Alkaline shock response membrane anchor protein AmaP n=1 Tax=Cellulomonas wangleii TaxID=2816956 RepID=A0ABX8D586_9CELL|nr:MULTISPECIES: hypothetical protein [Cellulomonas]MBO0898373.1 hypothetical protein [Cellulomonas sp. zg-ZUI22]MBO0919234.1 hypothetical protein [Cellulomonas wangleii]MBO0924617.1 hypothetical protein [Cellulomonas wangleii]QVI62594.1 hypothetical protein KG103_01165 [Cellulomonas wangleii]